MICRFVVAVALLLAALPAAGACTLAASVGGAGCHGCEGVGGAALLHLLLECLLLLILLLLLLQFGRVGLVAVLLLGFAGVVSGIPHVHMAEPLIATAVRGDRAEEEKGTG